MRSAISSAIAPLTTELDVNQQKAQLATDQAQLPELESQASAITHAPGLLLGDEPAALTYKALGGGWSDAPTS
jgi:outer membrane protein TolC